MYSIKGFICLIAAITLGSAIPSVDRRAINGDIMERNAAPPTANACGGNIGNCYENGCDGAFPNIYATLGTCMAGAYYGCPCNKCGSGHGYVGSCFDNGCQGEGGICMAGNYLGCPCNPR